MGKKRDVFWILDNYMTSAAMAGEVKSYIEKLIKEKENAEQKNKRQPNMTKN